MLLLLLKVLLTTAILLILPPMLYFGVKMIASLWLMMLKDLEEYRERHRKADSGRSGNGQHEHDSDEKPPVS